MRVLALGGAGGASHQPVKIGGVCCTFGYSS